jgi:type II secretory pathway component GspD/PulD (secretin)/beta-lactamase regulating signal transducer with metallopeptidase domain
MNPTPSLWLHVLGLLAIQTALVIALAAAVQPLLRPARWKHTVWLAALAGTVLVFANALFGLDRHVHAWLTSKPAPSPQFIVRGNLPVQREFTPPADLVSSDETLLSPPPVLPSHAAPKPVWWPAWLWLAGAILLSVHAMAFRLWFALVWRRRQIEPDEENLCHVSELAARLGLRRRVHVVASPSLAAPIAFDALRPTIGLPADFWQTHSRAEQDAMLLHELAHLAARDPLWLVLADAATALLWWHPLVWWARRQFRAACEATADEASLLLDDGPAVLAGCLVTLAGRLQQRRETGLLGMAGFRSGLGRRVERLLALPSSGARPVCGGRFKFAVAGGVLAGVALVIGTTAWALPHRGAVQPTLLVLAEQTFVGALAPANAAMTPTNSTPTATSPQTDENTGATAAPAASATNTPPASPVSTLVQDGKLLYEMGKLDEAETKLKSALGQDSNNAAALYYLNLAQNASGEEKRREQAAKSKLVEVEKPWNPPALVSTQLCTRTYKVDPHIVVHNLEAIAGRTTHPASTNMPPPKSGSVLRLMREYFTALGVDFGGTNVLGSGTNEFANGFQTAQGKAMFFNERNGILLVRATGADMDILDSAISALNVTPPQVVIEARFVEIPENDSKALGFDWYLGNLSMNSPAGTNGPQTVTGLRSGAQFRGVFPGVPSTNTPAIAVASTNQTKELRGDQLDWAGKGVTNAHNLRVTAALGTRITGILTEPQFHALIKALEQRAGVDVLTAPKVTTLSGRQAQIQVSEMQTVVTGIDPKAIVQPNQQPPGGTNATPFTTAQIPLGPTLDVLPTVGADGYSIELKVTPTVIEFLGYDQPPKDTTTEVWENGKPKSVALPLPRFRVRQMETTARVWDGQTLVLGGLTSEDVQKLKEKVPVLGDLPLIGSMFRSESQQTVKKRLLVFVTATIIDPAGNQVHPADTKPFDPNRIPAAH